MPLHETRNPAFYINIAKEFSKEELQEKSMTIEGTINKTFLLLGIVILSAYATWISLLKSFTFESFESAIITSSISGFLLGIYIIARKQSAPKLAPIYCICQGIALGCISAVAEEIFPGIVIQAISLTFAILIMLLIIYRLGIIRPNKTFSLIINSITAGIALYYSAAAALKHTGVELPLIHENSTGGIIFSAFVVILASLNLVLDFEFINQGAQKHLPKYMEWYCAFGLMVTILWLYLEVLNLLMKTRSKK